MPALLKTILVGYDGFDRDEPIPEIAVDLAAEHGARLHVLHVVPKPRRSWKWLIGDSVEDLNTGLVEERCRVLGQRVDAVTGTIDAHAEVRSGVPYVEIIREAMAIDADLVVVIDEPGQSGRRGFGTVTTKLLRKCPCPVLATRKRVHEHDRVLAAVDVGPTAPDESPPNRAVIDLAATLVRQAGGRLVVFHAWSLWNEEPLRVRGGLSEREVNATLAEEKDQRQRQLDQLVEQSRVDDIDVDVKLVKGDPRDLLPVVIAEQRVSLVVMGTVSRTGLLGFIIGNTAERILNDLTCSVLAVKPEGFVSPVRESD